MKQSSADHRREHLLDPVRIRDGRCVAPTAPGLSAPTHAERATRV